MGQLVRAALQRPGRAVPGGAPIERLNTLALPARAKLNLDLRVTGRRADGFHDIETTIQSIDLHDLLTATRTDGEEGTLLTTSGLGVVNDANNSILKAHDALEHAANRRLPARFTLHKRIPPGSGMGGASSDAAAALRAIKTLYHLDDVDHAPIAAEVGADVAFFLHGGRMRAEGRGETLTALTMQPAMFVIAWPGIELETGAVYKKWDEVKGEGPNELRRAAEQLDARVKEFAARLGPGWQMTGSGSAFFKPGDRKPQLDCWTAVARAVGPWS